MPRFKPHRWQSEAVAEIDAILGTSDHAYLQAPTGVGKTFAILMHGEQSTVKGYRTIIIGTDQITQQHRRTFESHGIKSKPGGTEAEYISTATGNLWLITTWQSIARSPEKFKSKQRCGLLYFDECHLGGARAANVSYPRIVETLKPRKRVMISATANVVSEKLLGKMAGHIFKYTMSQAYTDGLLNPVDVVEVQTGLTAEIKRIEYVSGESMEDLEELTDSDLAHLAVKLKARHVAHPDQVTEAARKIVEYRHKAMIDKYLAKHRGQSAIFWSPNIDAANRAAEHFATRTKLVADTVHSKLGGTHATDRIVRFHNRGIAVVFAVAMLQEGFDMPELALSFDCRFHRQINKQRIARMLQRIGRLTRKMAGKPRSRYYVAPDLTHYYSSHGLVHGSILTASLLAAADMVSSDDTMASVTVHPGEEIGLDVIDTEADIMSGKPSTVVTDITQPRTKEPARITSLYIIDSVRGYRETETIMLSEVYGGASDRLKAEILADARAGKPIPSSVHEANRYLRLRHYMRFDSDYAAAIVAANPSWAIQRFLDLSPYKAQYLADAKAGKPVPVWPTPEYSRLRHCQAKDIEFAAAIEAANPAWAIVRKNNPKAKRAAYLAAAKAGKPKPQRNDTDYATFVLYMRTDSEFAAAIEAANPAWGLQKAGARKAA